MNLIKPLPPLEQLVRCYCIDPSDLSGLSRIGSPGRKQGKLGPTGGVGSDGYWRVTHLGEIFRVHRIIWALHYERDPGDMLIDHRDGNPLNNVVANLRACTSAQNLQNKRSPGRRTGVSLPKNILKSGANYIVKIMSGGLLTFMTHGTLEAAESCARELRIRLHGEYAKHT